MICKKRFECCVKIHLYLVLYLIKYLRLIFALFLQLLRHRTKNVMYWIKYTAVTLKITYIYAIT